MAADQVAPEAPDSRLPENRRSIGEIRAELDAIVAEYERLRPKRRAAERKKTDVGTRTAPRSQERGSNST
jgi:hypothetical protein